MDFWDTKSCNSGAISVMSSVKGRCFSPCPEGGYTTVCSVGFSQGCVVPATQTLQKTQLNTMLQSVDVPRFCAS